MADLNFVIFRQVSISLCPSIFKLTKILLPPFSRAKSRNNERHEDRGSILNKREPIKRVKRVTTLIFSPDSRDRACRLRGSRPRGGRDTNRGPKPGRPEPGRLVQVELRIRKRDQGARGGPFGERWPRERGDERAGKLQLSQ